jgi:hypothetical protein
MPLAIRLRDRVRTTYAVALNPGQLSSLGASPM